jgi:hypothetical protein
VSHAKFPGDLLLIRLAGVALELFSIAPRRSLLQLALVLGSSTAIQFPPPYEWIVTGGVVCRRTRLLDPAIFFCGVHERSQLSVWDKIISAGFA